VRLDWKSCIIDTPHKITKNCSLQFINLATGDNEMQKREFARVFPVYSMKAYKRNRGRAPMEGSG
jgi:hypothetical protein